MIRSVQELLIQGNGWPTAFSEAVVYKLQSRGFKAIVLCDVLIRAQLGMSRIHYTDYRVSVLL